MLEKKDLRLKLEQSDHAGLVVLAEIDGKEIAEWAETILVAEIRRRVHDARLVHDRLHRLGFLGMRRESDKKQ